MIIENMLLTNSSGLGFQEDSGTIRKTLSEGLHRMYLNGSVIHGLGRSYRQLARAELEGTCATADILSLSALTQASCEGRQRRGKAQGETKGKIREESKETEEWQPRQTLLWTLDIKSR